MGETDAETRLLRAIKPPSRSCRLVCLRGHRLEVVLPPAFALASRRWRWASATRFPADGTTRTGSRSSSAHGWKSAHPRDGE